MRDTQAHFDRTADRFDAIYSGDSVSTSQRLLDRILRYDIFWRLDLTLDECTDIEGRSVLDIGCGSGAFLDALGRRGAGRLVGLDFAPRMLEIAERRLTEAGIADRADLRLGDFMEQPDTETFDYTLAIGVFDYIEDPLPMLRKMAKVTSRKTIVTFPQLWNPWTLVRRVRYSVTVRDCPLHFFSRGTCERLMREAGFENVRVRTLTNIFFVVGERSAS